MSVRELLAKLEKLLRELVVSMPSMAENASALLRRIQSAVDRVELNSLAWYCLIRAHFSMN
jgi:hypothetical protein